MTQHFELPPQDGLMVSRRRASLYVPGILLTLACTLGWLSPMLSRSWAGPSTELPLINARGIAVDSAGLLFCGSQYYQRVQVYGPEGRFLRGWHVETFGGVFRMRVNSAAQLEVATARGGMLYRFTSKGELLDQTSSPESFLAFSQDSDHTCCDELGTKYWIDKSSTTPKVLKSKPGGVVVTAMTPASSWPFFALPGVSFLLFFVGVALTALGAGLMRRRNGTATDARPSLPM